MKIFDGRKTAQKILDQTAADIKKLKIRPCLAVILVGEDDASKLYVQLKKAAAAKIGVEVMEFDFPAETSEEKIISRIETLNRDEKIHGILVQLPLPAVFNKEKIIGKINPMKDVDGFHTENQKLLKIKKSYLWPVLPLAILAAVEEAKKERLNLKNVVALVNSQTLGQVLKILLEEENLKTEYLVRNTCLILGAEKRLKEADVLISVCGCPQMIKGDMIKVGVVLIDAGITRYHDKKVVGDMDRMSVENKAAFLTPTPGGIGPVTVALLLRNVFLAARLARQE